MKTFEIHRLDEHWVEGQNETHRFQAKVYAEGSRFGINQGRISKLCATRATPGQAWEYSEPLFSYDRGWDEEPHNEEEREILRTILAMFE